VKRKPEIRGTTPADYERIADLTAACYVALAPFQKYTSAELTGLLTECCSIENTTKEYDRYESYVAVIGSRIVGVIGIDEDRIEQLFIDPEFQKRGIGGILLEKAENIMRGRGCKKIRVWSATAPDYYVKKGYVIDERKTCDYGPLQGRPVAVMSKYF